MDDSVIDLPSSEQVNALFCNSTQAIIALTFPTQARVASLWAPFGQSPLTEEEERAARAATGQSLPLRDNSQTDAMLVDVSPESLNTSYLSSSLAAPPALPVLSPALPRLPEYPPSSQEQRHLAPTLTEYPPAQRSLKQHKPRRSVPDHYQHRPGHSQPTPASSQFQGDRGEYATLPIQQQSSLASGAPSHHYPQAQSQSYPVHSQYQSIPVNYAASSLQSQTPFAFGAPSHNHTERHMFVQRDATTGQHTFVQRDATTGQVVYPQSNTFAFPLDQCQTGPERHPIAFVAPHSSPHLQGASHVAPVQATSRYGTNAAQFREAGASGRQTVYPSLQSLRGSPMNVHDGFGVSFPDHLPAASLPPAARPTTQTFANPLHDGFGTRFVNRSAARPSSSHQTMTTSNPDKLGSVIHMWQDLGVQDRLALMSQLGLTVNTSSSGASLPSVEEIPIGIERREMSDADSSIESRWPPLQPSVAAVSGPPTVGMTTTAEGVKSPASQVR